MKVPAGKARGRVDADLEATRRTLALIALIERAAGPARPASWEDFFAGVEALGGDRAAAEALHRAGFLEGGRAGVRLTRAMAAAAATSAGPGRRKKKGPAGP